MNAKGFRAIALGMRGATEGSHMGHPDFRVNGRIFATLHPDQRWGMVKLTPEQQQQFIREWPDVFEPEPGTWGLQGCTAVRLDSVEEETLGEALTLAFRNRAEQESRRRPSPSRKARAGSRPPKGGEQ